MNKILKRSIVLSSCAVLAAGSIAGCGTKSSGKNGETDMFDIVKNMSSTEKYTSEMTFSGDFEGVTFEAVLSMRSDGNATAMGVELSASGLSFEFEDVIIYTDDVLYINVAEVEEEFSVYLNAYGIDLSELGLDSDWVTVEAEGLFAKDTTVIEMICDDLNKAYGDLVEKDGDKQTIEIKDDDTYKDLISATQKMLEKNSSKWSEKIAEYYNKFDVEPLITSFAADFSEAISEMTDYDKDTLYDEIMDEVDMSGIEDVSASDVKEGIDEMADTLKEADTYFDFESITMTVEESKDSNIFTMEAVDSDSSVTMKYEHTEDKSVKVEVPSEDSSQSIGEVMAIVYVLYTLSTGY